MDLGKQDDKVKPADPVTTVPVETLPVLDSVPEDSVDVTPQPVASKREQLQKEVALHERELLRLKTELANLPGSTEPPPGYVGLWPPVRVATKEEIAASKRTL